jgi:hypothetical protein
MATTWSASNKSTHVTLTGSNLIATADGTTADVNGRSDTSVSGSQRIFWVMTFNAGGGTDNGMGIANASWTFADGSFMGLDAFLSLGYYTTGNVFLNNGLAAAIATYTVGAVLGVALDRGADKVWFFNGTNWNNDVIGNQNPAVGSQVGGITTGITGALFPAYEVSNLTANGQWTLNAGATVLPYPIPTGFSTFDDTILSQSVM